MFVSHLESALDGTSFQPDRVMTVHEGRPLWVRYDLGAVRKALGPEDLMFLTADHGCEATDVFGHAARLGGPLAFCFVDGAHAAENVRRDFENVHAHLVRGGLVLFDDSDPYGRHPHIYGVVEDALGRGYELLADYPGHLIRKVDG